MMNRHKVITIALCCVIIGLLLLSATTPAQARPRGHVRNYIADHNASSPVLAGWMAALDSWMVTTPFSWVWGGWWSQPVTITPPPAGGDDGQLIVGPPGNCGGDDGFISYNGL